MYIKLLLLLCLCTFVQLDDPVLQITKCEWDDVPCITASTNAFIPTFTDGIPGRGVEKLDPLFLESVDASSPTLKCILEDINISGLRNCRALRVERNLEKSKLDVFIQCTVGLTARYDMEGKLLFLPISGRGNVEMTIRKIVIDADLDLEEVEKNGLKYWRVTKWDYKFNLNDKSDVHFENIFAENEVLAKAAQDVVENNGNDVVLDIGPPIIKFIVGKVVYFISEFMQSTPVEELVID